MFDTDCLHHGRYFSPKVSLASNRPIRWGLCIGETVSETLGIPRKFLYSHIMCAAAEAESSESESPPPSDQSSDWHSSDEDDKPRRKPKKKKKKAPPRPQMHHHHHQPQAHPR